MTALTGAGQSVSVAFENIGDNTQQVFLGFAQSVSPALSAAFNIINEAFDKLFPSLESITKFFEPLTTEAERFSKLLEGNPRAVEALALAFESLLSTGVNPVVEGLAAINDNLENKPTGLVDTITELELRLRRAAFTASGLVKIITAPGRFGGILSQEARDQLFAGLADIQKAFSAREIDVPINVKPDTQDVSSLAGDLSSKTQGLKDALIAGADALFQKVKQAAETIRNAQSGFANQVTQSFDIATNRQRAGARKIFLDQINAAQQAGAFDPRRAALKYGGGYSPAGSMTINGETTLFKEVIDFSRLSTEQLGKLAAEVTGLQNAEETLAKAVADNSTYLKQLAEKNWGVSVQVNADGTSQVYGDAVNGALQQ
jgi:hypothetical protein